MSDFEQIEEAFRSGGSAAIFDLLIRTAREGADHRLLFQVSILRVRHRLGLPLIETEAVPELTDQQRPVYETAFREGARAAGELCLAQGDIPGAWPYFKAIGEHAPIEAAIENVSGGDNIDRVIEIAFQEGVNPRKGFELILEHHGICSAITWFSANRDPRSRRQCLRLLVRALHGEIAGALKRTIASAEGAEPATARIAELIAGRDWLFENMSTYTDATHLTSILRMAPELEDDESLRLALEMAEYGQRLDAMYHFRGEPPFDDTYHDAAIYLKALLGDDVDAAVAHFRGKVAHQGDAYAEVLIDLLSRRERYAEAIQLSIDYLPDATLQLCQQAGDFATLKDRARDRGDRAGFAAGIIQAR